MTSISKESDIDISAEYDSDHGHELLMLICLAHVDLGS